MRANQKLHAGVIPDLVLFVQFTCFWVYTYNKLCMPRVLILSMEENIEFIKEHEAGVPMEMKMWPQQTGNVSVTAFVADRNKDLGPRPRSQLGENETAVACICGTTEDIYGELGWVQCDHCFVWQHIDCVGYDEVKEENKRYFCERCDHLNSRKRPYTMEEAANRIKELFPKDEAEESDVPSSVERETKKTEILPTRETTREKRKIMEKSYFSPSAKKYRSSSPPRVKKERSSVASTPRPRGRPPKASTPRPHKGKPTVTSTPRPKKEKLSTTSTPRPRGRPPKASTPRRKKEKPTVMSTPRPKRGRPPLTSTSSTEKENESVPSVLPAKKEALNDLKARLPPRLRPLMDHQNVSGDALYSNEQEPFSHKVVHKAVKKLVKQIKTANFELPANDDYYSERLECLATREAVPPQAPLGNVLVVDDSTQRSGAALTVGKSVGEQDQSAEQNKQSEFEENQSAAPVEEAKTGRRLSVEEYQSMRKDTGLISATENARKGFIPPLANVQSANLSDAVEKINLEAKSNEAELDRYCIEQTIGIAQYTTLTPIVSDAQGMDDLSDLGARVAFFSAERARERAKGEMSLSRRADRVTGVTHE